LTPDLREVLFSPTYLSKVSRRLIDVAWKNRHLFQQARSSVPANRPTTNPIEERKQVTTLVQPLFEKQARSALRSIESELRLLATVATHYVEVRKFAKLDGFDYRWPNISRLAKQNYSNLVYVEECLVSNKRPTETELDSRGARELFDLCANDP